LLPTTSITELPRSEAARPWRNPVIMLVPCADRNHHRHDGPEKTVLELQFSHSGIVQKDFRMARVFVTGSADGLGKMAGELLIEKGHKVVLHARSAARADETQKRIAGAEGIVVGDLSSIAETKSVAEQVNKLGGFDAVIHNAGIGYREPNLVKTVDGLPQLFAVNSLAPYILTALITMPKRLVYLSSGMHYGAGSHLGTTDTERQELLLDLCRKVSDVVLTAQ
jgi:NADPH:quinone reductase-like Zn-dependent oxidoreductase